MILDSLIQLIILFVVILFSLYIYLKILNLNPTGVSIVKIILGVIFTGIFAICIYILREPMPIARFAVLVLAIATFTGAATSTRFDLSLSASVIAVGISYGVLIASVTVSQTFMHLVTGKRNDVWSTVLFVVLHSAAIILFFRIKRFRKGVLFLRKKGLSAIGLLICGIISFIFLLFNAGSSIDTGVWLLAGTALCIAGLIFWWRYGLTKLYREKVKERNSQEYEKIIEEKDKHIQQLIEDNDNMAKLIHRDNKLLPALHNAVMLLVETCSASNANVNRLLEQIEQLMHERNSIISQSQSNNNALPSTNDAVIDGIISYMMQKAFEESIQFDIVATGGIAELTDSVISAVNLETLFADLIENAIIATSHSENEKKQITILVGATDDCYELSVMDSGIPFEIETLISLGQIKTSTHLNEGGSGIGFMAVFEILHECRASLVITECVPGQSGFTKSVTIRFDDRDEYIVQSHRADQLLIAHDLSLRKGKFPIIRCL